MTKSIVCTTHATQLMASLVVPGQNLEPDLLMMQPAQDWNRGDTADLLSPTKIWSIFLQ